MVCWILLNRTFTFSSAGHCEPIYLDPSQGRARLCTVETGFPIGVTGDARYPVSSITMEHGGVLLLYTDGLTEAFNMSREQFGQRRLMDVLEALQGSPATAVRHALLESLDEHRGPVQLADDVTLLIIRVLSEGTQTTQEDAP